MAAAAAATAVALRAYKAIKDDELERITSGLEGEAGSNKGRLARLCAARENIRVGLTHLKKDELQFRACRKEWLARAAKKDGDPARKRPRTGSLQPPAAAEDAAVEAAKTAMRHAAETAAVPRDLLLVETGPAADCFLLRVCESYAGKPGLGHEECKVIFDMVKAFASDEGISSGDAASSRDVSALTMLCYLSASTRFAEENDFEGVKSQVSWLLDDGRRRCTGAAMERTLEAKILQAGSITLTHLPEQPAEPAEPAGTMSEICLPAAGDEKLRRGLEDVLDEAAQTLKSLQGTWSKKLKEVRAPLTRSRMHLHVLGAALKAEGLTDLGIPLSVLVEASFEHLSVAGIEDLVQRCKDLVERLAEQEQLRQSKKPRSAAVKLAFLPAADVAKRMVQELKAAASEDSMLPVFATFVGQIEDAARRAQAEEMAKTTAKGEAQDEHQVGGGQGEREGEGQEDEEESEQPSSEDSSSSDSTSEPS